MIMNRIQSPDELNREQRQTEEWRETNKKRERRIRILCTSNPYSLGLAYPLSVQKRNVWMRNSRKNRTITTSNTHFGDRKREREKNVYHTDTAEQTKKCSSCSFAIAFDCVHDYIFDYPSFRPICWSIRYLNRSVCVAFSVSQFCFLRSSDYYTALLPLLLHVRFLFLRGLKPSSSLSLSLSLSCTFLLSPQKSVNKKIISASKNHVCLCVSTHDCVAANMIAPTRYIIGRQPRHFKYIIKLLQYTKYLPVN